MFNNNDGTLSVNIEHNHFYNSRIFNNKNFKRKIEFNEENEQREGGEIKKPQPINLRHGELNIRTEFNQNSLGYYSILAKDKKFSCNCKKSKCLKLYCECFANGEFCINCNCQDCSNVIENNLEKQEAFRNIKDKNPVAIKLNSFVNVENPQNNFIGCNCTKSNCLKKYCECYKAKVSCTDACRCRGCSNHNGRKVNSSYRSNNCYANFVIEKISVLIQDKRIYIETISINIGQDQTKEDNNNIQVKEIGTSFIIEVKKNVIEEFFAKTETPYFNRKRSRNENLSSIGCLNMNVATECNVTTKTACETNRKLKYYPISNVIGKKLNMAEYNNESYFR